MATVAKYFRIILNLGLFTAAIWLVIISTGKAWYIWVPVVALPILFVFFCLALMEDTGKSSWYHFAKVHTGVLIIFAVAFGLLFAPMSKAHNQAKTNREFIKQMEANAAQVCKSQPAAAASVYDPNQSGVHPIVFFYSYNKAWDEKPLWKPEQVADTQLVACIDGSSTEKGICFFTKGGQKYYHAVLFLYLYNAKTGALVDEKKWICDGYCPGELTDDNAHELCSGFQLPFSEAMQWLEPFVETE